MHFESVAFLQNKPSNRIFLVHLLIFIFTFFIFNLIVLFWRTPFPRDEAIDVNGEQYWFFIHSVNP